MALILCKGHCQHRDRFTVKASHATTILYLIGYKHCDRCEVMYKTEKKTCYCCGAMLSDRPMSYRARMTLRTLKENPINKQKARDVEADFICRVKAR